MEIFLEQELKFDFRNILFPSDQLTIGTLRKQHHEDFDSSTDACIGVFGDHPKRGESNTSAAMNNMLFSERVLVECIWIKASGMEYDPKFLKEERDGSIELLTELYTRYGIASGPQHAEQLIRNIESQATAAAKQLPGR